MAQADASIKFDTKIDNSKLNKSLSGMSGTIKKGFGQVTKIIAGVSTALAGLGGIAIKQGIDFETAFAGVKKTVDATAEGYAKLEQGIRDMSKKLPQGASAIASVAEVAGQLDIAEEDILKFTKTMIDMGESTNLSSEVAAGSIARFSNITGMSVNNVDRMGSAIVALGNNFATSESEIMEMTMRIAGMGAQLNMTESEMLAWSTAMSSVGINAEAGGSSFSKFGNSIAIAVETGSTELENFANVANMSVSDFSRVFKEDASAAIFAFIKGLKDIENNGGSVIATLDNMNITEVRMVDTLLRLVGASDEVTRAIEIGNTAWEENTALTEEAEQRYSTMESQLSILKNKLTDIGISFYKDVNTPMAEAVIELNGYIDTLTDLQKAFGLKGIASGLGNIGAEILGAVANLVPTILEAGQRLLGAFIDGILSKKESLSKSVIVILSALGEVVLSTFESVIKLGIELAASIAQGMVSEIPNLVSRAKEVVLSIAETFKENAPIMLDAGIEILLELIEGIIDTVPELIPIAVEVINSLIQGFIKNIDQIMQVGIELVEHIGMAIVENAGSLVESAFDLINALVDGIANNLSTLIDVGINIILAIVKGIVNSLPKMIEEVPKIINKFADSIYEQLPTILRAGIEIIIELAKGLIKAIPTLISNIPQIIKAIVNVFTLYNWVNLGKSLIKSLSNGIKSMISNIGSVAKGLATNALETIKMVFSNAPSVGKGLVEHLITGIRLLAEALINLLKNIGLKALEGFKNIDWLQLGKDIVLGIVNGIKNMGGALINSLKNLASNAFNSVKSFFKISSPSKLFKEEIGKPIVQGMIEGISKEEKKAIKAAEELAKNTFDSAKIWIKQYRLEEDYLASEEVKMWKELQKRYEKNTKERIEIDKHYFDAKEKMQSEEINQYREYLTKQKDLKEASDIDIYATWYALQSQYEEGAKARIEIEKELATLEKEINKERLDLQQQIIDKEKEYEDAVDSRAQAIFNTFGLFEELTEKEKVAKETLTENLKAQVKEMTSWADNMQKLSERGVEDGLLKELQDIGPKANEEIKALLSMSEYQLEEYSDLWVEKNRIAKEQSLIELKGMRENTEKEIKGLQDELNKLDLSPFKDKKQPEDVGIIIIQKLTETVKELAKEKGVGTGILEAISSKVREDIDELAKPATQVIERIIRGMLDNFSKFKPFVRSLFQEVRVRVSEMSWDSVGESIINGMVAGLYGRRWRFDQAIRDIMRQAQESAESEADAVGYAMTAGVSMPLAATGRMAPMSAMTSSTTQTFNENTSNFNPTYNFNSQGLSRSEEYRLAQIQSRRLMRDGV